MQAIPKSELAAVCGGTGPNQDSSTGPLGGTSRTRSDYAYCVDRVTQETKNAIPDTRPSILGLPLPFTNDDNATARANATMQNIATVCGQPPQ